MTDAGPLDLLVELRDRDGGQHALAELSTRAVAHEFGGVIVRLAALAVIAASKAFADRPKIGGAPRASGASTLRRALLEASRP